MAAFRSCVWLLVSLVSTPCLLVQGAVPRCVILAPNIVTVGEPFTAHVVVYDATGVSVTLVISDVETDQPLTNTTVTARKDTLTEVTLTVPTPPTPDDLGRRYVSLGAVTSAAGLQLPAKARLLVSFRRGHVFISLNKPKYHREDQVSGRLFSVTEDLMPLPRDLRVDILNPGGQVVDWGKPILDGSATYRFQLKLPKDASSGTWQLAARHGHQFGAMDVVHFEVINTNIPALELHVKTDERIILPTTQTVTITVIARYPTEIPVNGTASVQLSATTEGGDQRPISDPTDPKHLNLRGEATFTVPVNNHNFRFDDLLGSHLAVKARIMNHDTGVLQTASDVTSLFVSYPYVIETSLSSPTYKPSLPYELRALVVDPFGEPVSGVLVKVQEGQGDAINKTTDDTGLLEHVIDVGERISNIRWRLETVTGLGDRREARANLVVSRQASPSGYYVRVSGAATTGLGSYEAEVKFFPKSRSDDSNYNVIHYTVTTKGSVRVVGSMAMNEKVFKPITFPVSPQMAPYFYLTVFYIRRDTGDVIADGLWVNVTTDVCQNDVRLTGAETLIPGGNLNLMVNGDPNTTITTRIMETRLMTSDTPTLTRASLARVLRSGECRHNGGQEATDVFYWGGLSALTDSGVVVPARTAMHCAPPKHHGRRRHRRSVPEHSHKAYLKDFGSSLEVSSFKLNAKGQGEVRTFMSALEGHWQVQVMGMSPTGGFCVSHPLSVRVHRPDGHLAVDVPYEARVNETVTVRGLFSWEYDITNVTAELQADSGLCGQLTTGRWTAPTTLTAASHHQVAAVWPLVPVTAERQTVRVRVTAKNHVDEITVTVMEHTFNVKPAGVERTVEQTLMMGSIHPSPHRPNQCFRVQSEIPYNRDVKRQTLLLRAQRPGDALYGTGQLEVRVTGEPLGHVIMDLPTKGLDVLVGREPVGCGEQSMMRVGPVVYAAAYLQQTDRLTRQMETATPATIHQGLAYMDKFRNESGAYSTWPGKDPSTWLTAYVMKVMAHASALTDGANQSLAALVCGSAHYVAGRQRADGRFDDPLGILFDQSIAGGVEGPVAMTAYVTVSLLEVRRAVPNCRQAALLNVTVGRAVAWLARRADNTSDPYTMSLMAYGLLLAHHPKGKDVLDRLMATATDNQGRNWKYWKIPLHSLSRDQRINLIRDPVLTMEIETAAYTLLALVEAGRLQQAGGVASWLTSQHRSNGRFIATQDTVVALQALTLYRGLSYRADLNQEFEISVIGRDGKVTHLTNEDRNLRHTFAYELPETSTGHTDLQLQVRGEGEVRVEVVCAYNSLRATPVCPLSLTGRAESRHFLTAQSPCYGNMGNHDACIQTCFSYPSGNNTNMAILYVSLHHLYSPHFASVQRVVQEDGLVDHVETEDRAVIFYLTQIPKEEHCISFVATSKSDLPLNSMPVPIHLYDYHDPERLQCEQFYQPNTMVHQQKRPIETYFTGENQFKCREVPEPVVHDFVEGVKPFEQSQLEEMLCYTRYPANTYAIVVYFTNRRFRMSNDEPPTPLLDARVRKVIKKGPTDLQEESFVEFYVKETWLNLQSWVNKTLNQSYLVVGTTTKGQGTQSAHRAYRLHLDDASVYLQRIAPQSGLRWPRNSPEWARWKKLRPEARKNKKYVHAFRTCNA